MNSRIFMKKVYVFGDVHDDLESLMGFLHFVEGQNPDCLFGVGDFSLRPYRASDLRTFLNSKRTSQDLVTFIDAKRKHNGVILAESKGFLDIAGIPYQVIPGNYDPILAPLFGGKDKHRRSGFLGEATTFGYGGADAYPRHILELVSLGQIVGFSHEELYEGLVFTKPDIVVMHNPPYGMCDTMFNGEHVGSKAATRYISDASPKLVLCGHIHEAGPFGNNPEGERGVCVHTHPSNGKKTVVVNPGNLGRFELVDFPSLKTARTFPYGTFAGLDLEEDGTPKRLTQYSLTGPEGKGNIGKVEKIREFTL